MLVVRLMVFVLGITGSCLSTRRADGAEYRLQVANLYRDSFAHFIAGSIGSGSGELTMPNLERALDRATSPRARS